jgi:hypothetical protein
MMSRSVNKLVPGPGAEFRGSAPHHKPRVQGSAWATSSASGQGGVALGSNLEGVEGAALLI